jgi:hypothetical protein
VLRGSIKNQLKSKTKSELASRDMLVDKNMPAIALASTSSSDKFAKLNVPSKANRSNHAPVQMQMAVMDAFKFVFLLLYGM